MLLSHELRSQAELLGRLVNRTGGGVDWSGVHHIRGAPGLLLVYACVV